MASLNTQDFDTLVTNMAAAVQGAASKLIDLTVGSILRAANQAYAGVVLWLQGLIVQVLCLTRASTSSGDDLVSWHADFGFDHLAAIFATGAVTFSRFTSTQQAIIPVGSVVQTKDAVLFAVTADATNPAYSPTIVDGGGYIVAAGVGSLTVPVQAAVAGTAGNVQPGTITSIAQPISGIDSVTNASAFTSGVDAEGDTSARSRFVLWLASLSKATEAAIASAIANVSTDLQHTITENQQYNGTTDYGYFYVVIDDGSGSPSSTLLATVASAIEAVRGLTSRFGVFAPVVVIATPAMTITSDAGYTHATVVASVATALQTAINGLPLGTSLPYTQLAAIAYAVDGVSNVTSITLNGGTADLTATQKQVIKCGTPVVA